MLKFFAKEFFCDIMGKSLKMKEADNNKNNFEKNEKNNLYRIGREGYFCGDGGDKNC